MKRAIKVITGLLNGKFIDIQRFKIQHRGCFPVSIICSPGCPVVIGFIINIFLLVCDQGIGSVDKLNVGGELSPDQSKQVECLPGFGKRWELVIQNLQKPGLKEIGPAERFSANWLMAAMFSASKAAFSFRASAADSLPGRNRRHCYPFLQ